MYIVANCYEYFTDSSFFQEETVTFTILFVCAHFTTEVFPLPVRAHEEQHQLWPVLPF